MQTPQITASRSAILLILLVSTMNYVLSCGSDDENDNDDDANDGICDTTDECAQGQVCVSHSCVNVQQTTCTADEQCVGAQTCLNGTCALPLGACNSVTDCPLGDQCVNEVCVASSDSGSNVLVIGDASTGGGLVTSTNGTTLTFGNGSLTTGSTVTVTDVSYDTVETAGGQTFGVVAGLAVEMTGMPTTPPVITVPNDDNLPAGSQILVTEVVDLPNGSSGINLVGTASVSTDGQSIVSNNTTDSTTFPGEWGVDESGTYIMIVTEGDQGFAVGQVTGTGGVAVVGAAVYASSGAFVGITDAGGYFAIPELIGSTTLYVTDPATGGYANIYVAVSATFQVVAIGLTTPTLIATGLPNGCLDMANFESYIIRGNTAVVSTLDPLVPTQGGGMVLMSTGTGAEAEMTSGLDITFTVPAGVSSLNFAYNFLSNEYPEYVGTQYNDLFNIIAYTSGGASLIIEERVNNAVMTDSATIYDGETGWKAVSVDVSTFSGLTSPITLSFVVSDVADTIYDTAALIDDLRFNTAGCDNEQISVLVDADGDSYASDVDCDDANAAIYPGAPEVCGDTVDNNCDGYVNEGCVVTTDADGDTYPPEQDCNDNDATIYPGAPEACDSLDNNCDGATDEACEEQLPQSHHIDLSAVNGFVSSAMYAIYQRFEVTDANGDGTPEVNYPLDLDGLTLTFIPSSDFTSYTVTASSLAWDSNEGTALTGSTAECDDCYDTQALPFTFTFYGTAYQEAFIGSNGYITFGAGDSTYTESVEYFLAYNPRISAFFDDLYTWNASEVISDIYVYADTAELVVTYRSIQHYSHPGTTANTFQFVLLADGTIRISYNGIQDVATGAIAGISPGSITTTVSTR